MRGDWGQEYDWEVPIELGAQVPGESGCAIDGYMGRMEIEKKKNKTKQNQTKNNNSNSRSCRRLSAARDRRQVSSAKKLTRANSSAVACALTSQLGDVVGQSNLSTRISCAYIIAKDRWAHFPSFPHCLCHSLTPLLHSPSD